MFAILFELDPDTHSVLSFSVKLPCCVVTGVGLLSKTIFNQQARTLVACKLCSCD